MTMTATSTVPTAPATEKDAFANSKHWTDAVRDVIKFRIDRQRARAEAGDPEPREEDCFSSGEIAAVLRTHRMNDLRFSVIDLGGWVRDLFDGDNMGKYLVEDDDGELIEESPLQVSRTTVGKGRTPAGQLVFVYGPDQEACDKHDFEVDIPLPPGAKPKPNKPAQLPAPVTGGYPTKIAAAVNQAPPSGYPTKTASSMTAKVIADCRVVIYRDVFEAWVHHAKKTMRSGAPVYIKFDNDKAYVSLDDPGDATTHQLHTGSRPGRVFFASPTVPFTPGDEYAVELTDDALVVDLARR